jgi:hypothetical protein
VELFETQFDFPPLPTDGRNMILNSLSGD